MGLGKHYLQEDLEELALRAFLQESIDRGILEETALVVTQQVIFKGRETLSPEQELVFRTQVWAKYVLEECRICGQTIPWQQMHRVRENDGRCSCCDDRISALSSIRSHKLG